MRIQSMKSLLTKVNSVHLKRSHENYINMYNILTINKIGVDFVKPSNWCLPNWDERYQLEGTNSGCLLVPSLVSSLMPALVPPLITLGASWCLLWYLPWLLLVPLGNFLWLWWLGNFQGCLAYEHIKATWPRNIQGCFDQGNFQVCFGQGNLKDFKLL